MAIIDQINKFRELINECTKFPCDEILENSHLGEMNLKDCRSDLECTYSILNQFKALPIDRLPDGKIEQIINALNSLKGIFNSLYIFRVGHYPNPSDMSKKLLRNSRIGYQISLMWRIYVFHILLIKKTI